MARENLWDSSARTVRPYIAKHEHDWFNDSCERG